MTRSTVRRFLIVILTVALFVLTPLEVASTTWDAVVEATPREAPDPEHLAWAGIAFLGLGVMFLRFHNRILAERAQARARDEAPTVSSEVPEVPTVEPSS